MGIYEQLIEELGGLINLELEVTENNTVCLVYPDDLKVQLEVSEADEEEIALISIVGEVPPGRYRTDLLTAALKSNGRPHPRYGNVSYYKETQTLVLYETIPFRMLNAERLKNRVALFSQNAQKWAEALKSGSIPSFEEEEAAGGARPFGL